MGKKAETTAAEADRRHRELEALATLASAVGQSLDLAAVLRRGLDSVLEITGLQAGGIRLADEEGTSLELVAHRGLSESYVARSHRILPKEAEKAGEAFETGEIIFVEGDPHPTGEGPRPWRRQDLTSVAYVPLVSRGKVLGVMSLASVQGQRTVTPDARRFLSTIGTLIGVAIENARLFERALRHTVNITSLIGVSREIVTHLPIGMTLRRIVQGALTVSGARQGFLGTVEGDLLHVSEWWNGEIWKAVDFTIEVGRGTAGWVLQEKRVYLCRDAAHDPQADPILVADLGIRGSVSVPVKDRDGHLVGVLEVHNKREGPAFTEGDAQILSLLAHQAAIALENAALVSDLHQAETEWKNTFNSITDLISIQDTDGRIVRVNTAMVMQLKSDLSALVGRRCTEVLHSAEVPWPGCPHVAGPATDPVGPGSLLQGPAVEEVEDPHLGGVFLISTFPLLDAEGRLLGSIHIAKDVTERRALQRQLLHTEQLARVGELAAGVMHEMLNPLNVISGRIQLLLRAPERLDPDVARSLQIVTKHVDRMTVIADSLLRFARKRQPEKRMVELNELVQEVIALLREQEEYRRVTIVPELATEQIVLFVDRDQIIQVLLNLLSNARDALPAGGTVHIRTRTLPASDVEFPRGAEVIVEDSGAGIPEQNLGRIFQPFFTTKEEGRGTGLGLSVSYGIVKNHGGRIAVESASGVGTRFIIHLPQG